MKEAFYFSHDYGARNDPKIKAMMVDFGREGYGWFWILVETLAEQKDYMLPCKKWAYASLASDFDCDVQIAQKYVQACVEDYELLNTDGEHFWSESLLRRMVIKEQKQQARQERASKAGQASAAKREFNISSNPETDISTNVQQEFNLSSTNVQQNPTKEKKVKEKKVKEYSPDSIEFRLASLLYQKIKEWHPDYNPDVDLHKWADDVRLLLQKQNPAQVQELILWCQADNFWRKNILSVSKLREQWDKLTAQKISQQPRAAPNKDPAAYYDPDPNGDNIPFD